MGRKVGSVVPIYGELGSYLTQCQLGRGLPLASVILIHPAVSAQQTMAANLETAVALSGEMGPHLTQ